MGRELILAPDILITSKTDLKGKIIYCNEDFKLYSGYVEQELFMRPHNIVRHPDMPRCIFKLLWDNIQEGKEVFAFVKNLTKQKSYYWVFANVTPSYNSQREIIGYYSVRRKASRRALEFVIPLYARLLEAEKQGMQAGEMLLQQSIQSFHKPYNEFIYTLQRESL